MSKIDAYRLFDAHCDTALRILAGESLLDRKGPVSCRKAEKFSCWRQIFAFCCEMPEQPGDILWEQLSAQAAEFRRRTPDRVHAVLGVEGCEQLSREDGAEKAFVAGFRIFGITWNYDNRFCGAAAGSGGGLTEEGRALVRRLGELQAAVDCSHMSDRGFYDLCDAAEKPFFASHSNARALCGHPRNLTDDQLRKLAEIGGVAGVNFYVPFLTDEKHASVSDVCDHILHMMNILGPKGVCLGMDFDGCDRLPRGLDRMDRLVRLVRALLRRGLSPAEVQGLLHDNLYDFLHNKLRSI